MKTEDKAPIICRANELHDHTNGEDLDNSIHEGFTVGKRGKVMYWYFIWHGNTTGNAEGYLVHVENIDQIKMICRTFGVKCGIEICNEEWAYLTIKPTEI